MKRDAMQVEVRQIRETMRSISPRLTLYKTLEARRDLLLKQLGKI